MSEIIPKTTPTDDQTGCTVLETIPPIICPVRKRKKFSLSGRKLVGEPKFIFASLLDNDDHPKIILTGDIMQYTQKKKTTIVLKLIENINAIQLYPIIVLKNGMKMHNL